MTCVVYYPEISQHILNSFKVIWVSFDWVFILATWNSKELQTACQIWPNTVCYVTVNSPTKMVKKNMTGKIMLMCMLFSSRIDVANNFLCCLASKLVLALLYALHPPKNDLAYYLLRVLKMSFIEVLYFERVPYMFKLFYLFTSILL
jgi:hypothetical protein